MRQKSTSVTNYTQEGFMVPVEIAGIMTYASINAEFGYDEEGLKPTDDYFVYLLHPKFGSCSFTLEMNSKKRWQAVNAPEWLKKPIINTIVKAI